MYTKEQIAVLFIDFLNRNNIKEQFRYNLFKDKRNIPLFNRAIPSSKILFAFSWKDSPQGGEFWADINDQWRLLLEMEGITDEF